MKRKVAYFLILFPVFLLILSACKSKTEGFLTILDSQNQQVYQTNNTKTLDEFADILDKVESEEDNEVPGLIYLMMQRLIIFMILVEEREKVALNSRPTKTTPMSPFQISLLCQILP